MYNHSQRTSLLADRLPTYNLTNHAIYIGVAGLYAILSSSSEGVCMASMVVPSRIYKHHTGKTKVEDISDMCCKINCHAQGLKSLWNITSDKNTVLLKLRRKNCSRTTGGRYSGPQRSSTYPNVEYSNFLYTHNSAHRQCLTPALLAGNDSHCGLLYDQCITRCFSTYTFVGRGLRWFQRIYIVEYALLAQPLILEISWKCNDIFHLVLFVSFVMFVLIAVFALCCMVMLIWTTTKR